MNRSQTKPTKTAKKTKQTKSLQTKKVQKRSIITKSRVQIPSPIHSAPIPSFVSKTSLTSTSLLTNSTFLIQQSKRGIKCGADELRAGSLIKWGPEEKLFKVCSVEKKMMGRRPTSLSLDLKCLQTNKVFPTRMMPADTVDRVDLDMKWLSFLYCDGEIGHLMDNDTFDQIEFPSEMLGKHREWIPTDSKVQCTFYEGALFSIIIPDNAVFEVLEEDNNINTRVSIPNYKSVLLNNNHKMAVPEFIKAGDKIKVRLEDQTFMIRVNE